MDELLPWIGPVARIIVGGVLIFAGLQKLRSIGVFAASLQSYAWLPDWSRAPVARGLPLAELGLGVVLIGGIYVSVAALLAVALFLTFAAAFGLTFGLARQADCGCFGPGWQSSTGRVVARNLSLSVLSVIAWAPPTLGAEVGASPLLALAGLAGLVALALSLSEASPLLRAETGVESQERRRFLRLAGGAVAGVTVAAVLGLLRKTPPAEAACLGCGTCGTDYIFLYCTAPCCGAYIVKKWNNCQTYCYECSQTVKVYCGVPVCC